VIILTPLQAERVRGLTKEGHALAPVPLANGDFALPESVLTDPEHAEFAAFLGTLPTGPVTGSDWDQRPLVQAHFAYSREWEPRVLVAATDTPPLVLL
jgi:hypothetical protein